jgi:hypothetical protein
MDCEKLRYFMLTPIAAATAVSLFLFVVLLISAHAQATGQARLVHWAQDMHFTDYRFRPREQSCGVMEFSLRSACRVEFSLHAAWAHSVRIALSGTATA